MPRRGGSPFGPREADAIARKLQAKRIKSGGGHEKAKVYYGDVLVAWFGIRRGTKSKNGHIPTQLKVSQSQALGIARCTVFLDDYIEILKSKGKL